MVIYIVAVLNFNKWFTALDIIVYSSIVVIAKQIYILFFAISSMTVPLVYNS